MEPNEDPTTATPDPSESATPDPFESATPEPDTAPAGKPDTVKRFLAMLIDGIIAVALSTVVGLISSILGSIVAGVYYVIRDGLDIDFMKQRSFGKKVMKLDVVRLDGKPMDLETSVKRNWMFGVGAITTILLYIPLLGWILIPVAILIAACIGLYECYKVLTDKEGRRWGDELAGTRVIIESAS